MVRWGRRWGIGHTRSLVGEQPPPDNPIYDTQTLAILLDSKIPYMTEMGGREKEAANLVSTSGEIRTEGTGIGERRNVL